MGRHENTLFFFPSLLRISLAIPKFEMKTKI